MMASEVTFSTTLFIDLIVDRKQGIWQMQRKVAACEAARASVIRALCRNLWHQEFSLWCTQTLPEKEYLAPHLVHDALGEIYDTEACHERSMHKPLIHWWDGCMHKQAR